MMSFTMMVKAGGVHGRCLNGMQSTRNTQSSLALMTFLRRWTIGINKKKWFTSLGSCELFAIHVNWRKLAWNGFMCTSFQNYCISEEIISQSSNTHTHSGIEFEFIHTHMDSYSHGRSFLLAGF